jgi:hypothetical protein
MAEPHFIVVSSARGPATPPRQHPYSEAARLEAERLAQAHPDDEFTVYASVVAVRVHRFDIESILPHEFEAAPPF